MDGQSENKNVLESENPHTQTVQPSSELRFIGYRPPKETGWHAYLTHHRTLVGAMAFMVFVVIVTGVIILSGVRAEQHNDRDSSEPLRVVQIAEEIQAEIAPAEIDITKGNYSLNKTGGVFMLADSSQVWLERTKTDWATFTVWGNWLFFSADRSTSTAEGDDAKRIIGIEAFNYVTREHVAVARLEPESGATIEIPMYIDGDYLYIALSGVEATGVIYRCQLEALQACVDVQTYFPGTGRTFVIDETTVVVVKSTDAAGVSVDEVSVFNPASGDVTAVTSANSLNGIGSEFAGVGADGLVWFVEMTGDEQQAAEDPEYSDQQLSNMYAVDLSGQKKFVLPALGFPIGLGVRLITGATVSDGVFLFANVDLEVLFDSETKLFGPVTKRKLANTATSAGISSESLSTILDIPSEFTLTER